MSHRVPGWIVEKSVDGIQPPATPITYFDGSTAIVANAFSAPFSVQTVGSLSVQVTCQAGSTLAGSFALQGSNDVSVQESLQRADGQQVNWCPLTFLDEATGVQVQSKAVVSGAFSFIFTIPVVSPRWMRLVFTFTSGSGNLFVKAQAKAVV